MDIFIRFRDIRRRASKSSEIGLNFACFWPLKFFGGRPPKFWTGIIKFGLVLTIVQNFKPVGPRISEISCSEKNIKKTSAVKLKSFRKLSFSGGLKSLAKYRYSAYVSEQCQTRSGEKKLTFRRWAYYLQTTRPLPTRRFLRRMLGARLTYAGGCVTFKISDNTTIRSLVSSAPVGLRS